MNLDRRVLDRSELFTPKGVPCAVQDQELQGVLGAGQRLPRGEKLPAPPLQLRTRLGKLGTGCRAGLDAGLRLPQLLLRKMHRLLAHLDFQPDRHERPVRPLD